MLKLRYDQEYIGLQTTDYAHLQVLECKGSLEVTTLSDYPKEILLL